MKCDCWLKYRKPVLLLAAMLLALLLALPAVAGAAGAPRSVRAGVFAFEGYHEYDAATDRYSGYGCDMLLLMQRYANLNFVFTGYDRTWEETQQDLLEGRIDLATSAAKTADRLTKYDFSLPVGMRTMRLNVRPEEQRFHPGDFSSYDGMVLGLLEGSSANAKVEAFAREKGFSYQARYYKNGQELQQALQAKEVDAVATSSLRRSGHEHTIGEFAAEYYYVIVKKGNKELLEQINYAILQLNNNQCTWQSDLYHANYHQKTDGGLDFTAREQEFIRRYSQGGEKLLIATDTDWPPFSWKDKDGYHAILPELLDRCMKLSGMSYAWYEGAADIHDASVMGKEEVNLYLGYSLSDKMAKTPGLLASGSLLDTSAAYLVRRDTTEIKRIAVTKVTPYLNQLCRPEAGQQLVEYSNSAAAREAVLEGKVDAAFLYNYDAQGIVNADTTGQLGYRLLPGTEVALVLTMRAEDDHTLMSIMQKCMAHISQLEKNKIIDKYASYTATELTFSDYLKMNPALGTAGALLLAGLLFWGWVSSKRRQVERRHSQALQAKVEEISALNETLQDKQAQLEEVSCEQEAQLEEISALNETLQDNQSRLEEAACEQEAQLEEITALNEAMQEKQARLEEVSCEQEAQLEEISGLNSRLQENLDIISNAGYGIWRIKLSEDGRHQMTADEALQRIFGVEELNLGPEELYVYYHSRLLFEDAAHLEALDYSQMQEGAIRSRILAWDHPRKGTIYINAGGTSHRQVDGSLAISGYCGDVTERQQQRQRLQRELEEATQRAVNANKAKSDFLFNMSHDIRTPMNAIMGFRDLLEKHQEVPERRADYLKKIESASAVLLSIINNVLEMARIEKGTLEVDEIAWSAEQFNDTLYSVFEELMQRKGLRFTRQIEVQNPYVFCDPIKLREIFINILSNAYKYTNTGGTVHMHLEELPSDREGWALYRTTITDTGIGMSEDYLPHIFEEFSREKSTTDAKIEGTGLGMPIVKRLVELLEGTIEVQSKKGEGTTFVVTIPHKLADRSNLVERGGVKLDPRIFEGKRILLAEDNELNAEIATEILGEAGFIVDWAEDGAICVEKLRNAPMGYYELILMDIQMPNLNGYEATRAIRHLADSSKANIKIIAMTANAFEEDKREAMRAGMNAHVAKPINVNELMKTLAWMIG